MSTLSQQVLAVAAVLGALAAIGKWLHLWEAVAALRNLAGLSTLTREFLLDWRGEPPRPGFGGRPSFPERMATNEDQTSAIGQQITNVQEQAAAIEDRTRLIEERTKTMNHDFRDEIGGQLALLRMQLEEVQTQTKQLERNGGSHLADTVHNTATAVDRLEEGVLDLSHRVTDVSAKADAVGAKAEALGERQEVLRAADQQLAMDLRHYVETEHADLLRANEGLRAALNEVLLIDEESRHGGDAD